MDTKDKVELLKRLFIIRDDVYARQWYSEEKKRGGYATELRGHCNFNCRRRLCEHVSPKPITYNTIVNHLKGKTIGIYNLSQEHEVKWICLDVDSDTDDGRERIQEYVKEIVIITYKTIGARFRVEWSGGRGYHIWIFFDPPVSADKAQSLGQYIAHRAVFVEGVHVEVFPKQARIVNFGNLVKLPLGIHQKTQQRSVFINNKFDAYPLSEQWNVLQSIVPLTPQDLDTIIEKHTIQSRIVETRESNGNSLTPPCLTRVMNEGAKEGTRDIASFRLASYLRDRGLNEAMTDAALSTWNRTLNVPALTEEEIEAKVHSAFNRSYSFFPCGDQTMDSYCASSCKLWERKLNQRWTHAPPQEAIGKISRD